MFGFSWTARESTVVFHDVHFKKFTVGAVGSVLHIRLIGLARISKNPLCIKIPPVPVPAPVLEWRNSYLEHGCRGFVIGQI
jgi:hypothetical protein